MTSGFLTLCANRRSCRSYRPDPVPREHLESALEAARLAPSACNRQPWRFAIVCDAARRERLVRSGLLPGIKMDWALGAPALVALGVERSILTHRLAPLVSGVDYAPIDLGIAGEHFVLRATELGLGTCWIGWIKPRKVRQIVGWPLSIQPHALISVGWPAGDSAAARTVRKDAAEIARWI